MSTDRQDDVAHCGCSHEVDIYEGRQWVGGKVASYVDRNGNHIEVRSERGVEVGQGFKPTVLEVCLG